MEIHRNLAEKAQSSFYEYLALIAEKGSQQHDEFMHRIMSLIERNNHEVNSISQQLGSIMEDRLDEIRKRQDHLIYAVETMQKNTYSLTSSQPTTTTDNTGEKL